VYDTVGRWFGAGQREGTEPDPRFSLANERTFLAWIRTGLALVGGGLAVAGFLPPMRVPHLREVVAIALLVLGSTVAFRAIHRYSAVQRAMRRGEPLPVSRFPGVLALAVGLGGLALAVANLR